MPSPRQARGPATLAGLLVAAVLGLAACGGGSAPEPGPSTAEDLCRDYRLAVTAVRVDGDPEQQDADFGAVLDAAQPRGKGRARRTSSAAESST